VALSVGDLIDGKYSIVRVIGEGGMGLGYEGENVRIHRRVGSPDLHAHIMVYPPEAAWVHRARCGRPPPVRRPAAAPRPLQVTVMRKPAVAVAPGASNGRSSPVESAATGAIIGSRHTVSSVDGAKTCA